MRLKVYVDPIPTGLSHATHRVAQALRCYAPDAVSIVERVEDAELLVVHSIGHGSFDGLPDVEKAILVYCLETTEDSSPAAWLPRLLSARLVYSYYDLNAWLRRHGSPVRLNYYRAPLGVDSTVFYPKSNTMRTFTCGTSGYVAESECIEEVAAAIYAVGGKQFHLGPPIAPGALAMNGLSDTQLAQAWSCCQYVAGLRRGEGFELPMLEGLVCGARPVTFDNPCYTDWFAEHAVVVPEVAPMDLVAALVEVFARPAMPVSVEERQHVAMKFSWEKFANGFWERLI